MSVNVKLQPRFEPHLYIILPYFCIYVDVGIYQYPRKGYPLLQYEGVMSMRLSLAAWRTNT